MAGGGALGALLGKALAVRDPLALRIVRNLAERAAPADAAAAFAPAADALARLLTARCSRPASLHLVAWPMSVALARREQGGSRPRWPI